MKKGSGGDARGTEKGRARPRPRRNPASESRGRAARAPRRGKEAGGWQSTLSARKWRKGIRYY